MLSCSEILTLFNEKHKGKYSYPFLIDEYKNCSSEISILCKIHGLFKQQVSDHKRGRGCPKCGMIKKINTLSLNRERMKSTQDEFIEQCKIIHKNKYDYSKTRYSGMRGKINIICPIHGEFVQVAQDHKSGAGCPKCGFFNTTSFKLKSKNMQAIVYFLRIKEDIYKVGFTTRPLLERLVELGCREAEVLKIKYFESAIKAFYYEQRILNKFKNYRYKGEPLLYSGNSELLKIENLFKVKS